MHPTFERVEANQRRDGVCQLSLSGLPGALVYKAALESLNLDSAPLPAQIPLNFMLLTPSRNYGLR